jgi:sigma-B regulation protein RsbU (phosphoserine phosphatase)
VQAALVVSGVLKAGELLAHRHDSLGGWLCAVQESVVPDLRRGLFVTMVVVALDPLTGEIECARAGHPPAFRSGPGGWIEVGAIGLAIGIGDNHAFRSGLKTQRLTMREQDDLLLFTDGLTEVMDRTGQEFGVVGLRGSVARHHHGSAQALVDGLAHDAAGHGSGVTEDDLTVLVIRRRQGDRQ